MRSTYKKFLMKHLFRSDVNGFLLPALGISDWKHNGVVQLYKKVIKNNSSGSDVLLIEID